MKNWIIIGLVFVLLFGFGCVSKGESVSDSNVSEPIYPTEEEMIIFYGGGGCEAYEGFNMTVNLLNGECTLIPSGAVPPEVPDKRYVFYLTDKSLNNLKQMINSINPNDFQDEYRLPKNWNETMFPISTADYSYDIYFKKSNKTIYLEHQECAPEGLDQIIDFLVELRHCNQLIEHYKKYPPRGPTHNIFCEQNYKGFETLFQ